MIHLKRSVILLLVALFSFTGSACTPEEAQRVIEAVQLQQAQSIGDGPSSPEDVKQVILEEFSGTGHEQTAIRVATCESGLRWNAKNKKSTASGPFQLLAIHWRGKFDPLNVRENVKKAYKLWKADRASGRSGWTPWAESKRCWS